MKMGDVFSTKDLANACGVHSNTIRNWEAEGYITEVPRKKNGYRIFSSIHLHQALIVHYCLNFTWISGPVRKAALAVMKRSSCRDTVHLKSAAKKLTEVIDQELEQADQAIEILNRWAESPYEKEEEALIPPLYKKEAAKVLNVTPETLRTWERNGLISCPRHPANGYTLYGPNEMSRLRIIRLLRNAGYSQIAILRMLHVFETQGNKADLGKALDTPDPQDDVYLATDYWMTKLRELKNITCKIEECALSYHQTMSRTIL